MDENDARKYIKSLILRNKPNVLKEALEHYKVRYGHTFWEVKKTPDAYEIAKDLFGPTATNIGA
jgi:hypothetical protein